MFFTPHSLQHKLLGAICCSCCKWGWETAPCSFFFRRELLLFILQPKQHLGLFPGLALLWLFYFVPSAAPTTDPKAAAASTASTTPLSSQHSPFQAHTDHRNYQKYFVAICSCTLLTPWLWSADLANHWMQEQLHGHSPSLQLGRGQSHGTAAGSSRDQQETN